MKNPIIKLAVTVLISMILLGECAFGQSKTGTTIGQFLLIEPSARAAAMGNVGVAMHEEVISAYFNPAAIGMQDKFGIQFTNSQWLADISYNYAAALINAGELGNLYLSATALNSGEIDVRTVDQPLGTGERYTVANIAFGLGYGKQLTDRFSLGVQANYLQERIWHSSLSTVSFNVGTVYQLTSNRMRIGASISNFGLQAGYSGRDLRIRYDANPDKYGDNSALPGDVHTLEYSLPVIFRVGLYMPLQMGNDNRLEFAVDAFHPNDNTESVSFGAEWTVLNVLSLRGGYQNLFLKDSEVGLTAGAGVQYTFGQTSAQLDFSWADHGRLENSRRITVGVRF